MRVAIIEDEQKNAMLLQQYLTQFSSENNVEIDSVHFYNGVDFLKQFQPSYDLILLDIEMPLLNGIEVAREIRKYDQNVFIIFITQMTQYAIEGYSVQALDYILKPVNYYAFSMKLKQVVQLLASRQTDFLILGTSSGKLRLDLSTLRYVEVRNHTLHYHLTTECVTSTAFSMGKLSAKLSASGFARCHHGYLVNLRFVTGYEKKTVSLNEITLPLSRTYSKKFLNELLSYWGG